MMKRFLCMTLALGLILSLCACGGPVKDKTNSSSDTPSVTSGPSSSVPSQIHSHGFEPYEAMTEDMKGTTIKFITYDDYFSKINYVGETAISNIYKDIGLNVEMKHSLEAEYFNKIKSMVASGEAPDVFKVSSSEYLPLTFEIAAPINRVSTVNLNEPIWDQSIIDHGTINDDVYFVNTIGSPWNISSALFYDKVFFEENGIKTPAEHYNDGTWTWDNFEKTVRKVKSIDPSRQGAIIGFDTFINSHGHSLLQYNADHQSFANGVNNDYFKVYNEYYRLKNNGLISDCYENAQQKSAMWVETITPLTFAPIKQSDEYKNIGFTYLPSNTKGTTSKIPSELVMFGIVEGSKNANAAGYFIRYWLDSYNYDLTQSFYSIEHGKFYYQLTNDAYKKHFNFDNAASKALGKNIWSYYDAPGSSSPATSLSTAVGNAKQILNRKINDRIYNTVTQYGISSDDTN